MTIVGNGDWTVGTDWPWPQIHFTENYIVGIALDGTDLKVYELYCNGDDWYSVGEKGRIGPVARILNVDVASFGPYYIIAASGLNGTVPWYKMMQRQMGTSLSTETVYPVNANIMPYGRTVCNFRQQAIIGGLSSNVKPWLGLGECSVAWSGIGTNDCRYGDGQDKTAGAMKMPWDENGHGKVYKVLPIGNAVRVYGDRGILDLVPTENSFGRRPHGGMGIINENACAGDELIHGFISNQNDFWLSTEEGVKKLGYRKHLETLTNDRIIVKYEPVYRRFYISDGTLAFILSEGGLYSTHQCMTSIGVFKGTLAGITKANADTKIRLATTEFDVGNQSMKTVESVEFGANYSTSTDITLTAALSTKYEYKGDFIDLDYVTLNERGIFTQKITGREFKLKMQATYDSDGEFSLNNIRTKIKFSDKHNIRGRISA